MTRACAGIIFWPVTGLSRRKGKVMKNLNISKGWFDEEKSVQKKKFCDHEQAITIDYDHGIEHCPYCGALGHYSVDSDSVEWTLPEYLSKQNYN